MGTLLEGRRKANCLHHSQCSPSFIIWVLFPSRWSSLALSDRTPIEWNGNVGKFSSQAIYLWFKAFIPLWSRLLYTHILAPLATSVLLWPPKQPSRRKSGLEAPSKKSLKMMLKINRSITTTEKVICSDSKLSSVVVFEPLQMCHCW
jgi:hypothetical protein